MHLPIFFRESCSYSSAFDLLGRLVCFCLLDERDEILCAVFFSVDVGEPFKSNNPCSIDPIFIRFSWRNYAICSHEDWAVELLESLILFPPGIPVIACEVIVLLEGRIGICRQHFSMRINVNSCVLCLLKKLFQIPKVVSADQDSWPVSHTYINNCRLRVSIGFSVCLIENRAEKSNPSLFLSGLGF